MPENKMIQVLLVGCGAISRPWLEYTLSRGDCRIAGIVEMNRERGEAARRKYAFDCPLFADLDLALNQVKPDLVYDLTYVTAHSQVVIKALQAGCHVFGEKPMTLTREEALQMIQTAAETGKAYSVMQNRRYQKPVQAIREFIASGKLGQIWMVAADIFVPADLDSIRNQLAKPMLQDNAIHTFDQARFLTGEDPVTAYCHSYNPVDSKYHGDAAGACIFELSAGAVFVYNCVMGTDGCNTSWESNWRIIGSRGSIIWDGFGAPYAEIRLDPQKRECERVELKTAWNGLPQHQGCLEEMYRALLSGRRSDTDCRDNYKSISMVFASVESALSQKKVQVL
ncbi:MAG TPA: oxidoreductase [Clostridiales bacterium]|nr:oxidoreductase [Clostridiales bacterium]